jgi:hypothetical protein
MVIEAVHVVVANVDLQGGSLGELLMRAWMMTFRVQLQDMLVRSTPFLLFTAPK